MNNRALRFILVSTISLTACSGDAEREVAGIPEVPTTPKPGKQDPVPDAGDWGDAPDGEFEDADGELVPNDADRSESGAQCLSDEGCEEWVDVGPCTRAVCQSGLCVAAPLPDGTACDTGNACTQGATCSFGACHGNFDVEAPGCLKSPSPGALWFTEIMGNPAAVPGQVDPVDGQWFEVRGSEPVRLEGMKLVYYEWDAGAAMPDTPDTPVIHTLSSGYSEIGYSVFLRSQDIKKNGWGSSQWGYSTVRFSKTKNARLLLVLPTWDGKFPLASGQIVAAVVLPAGTFDDAMKGRSWQLSADSDDASGVWCHAALSGMQYVDQNFGSPMQPNGECP